jgi:hypothetical protein
MVQTLIDNNMHEVLINNDQLRHNMSKKLVLQNFQGTVPTVPPSSPVSCYHRLYDDSAMNSSIATTSEPPLRFRPTYKYDVGTNTYDSSRKGRIPSWTDRILYSFSCLSSEHVQCIAYNSIDFVTTSDHKPVYASFVVSLKPSHEENKDAQQQQQQPGGDGRSQSISSEEKQRLAPVFKSESQVCSLM